MQNAFIRLVSVHEQDKKAKQISFQNKTGTSSKATVPKQPTQPSNPACPHPLGSKLTIPREQAHNPSGASSQRVLSLRPQNDKQTCHPVNTSTRFDVLLPLFPVKNMARSTLSGMKLHILPFPMPVIKINNVQLQLHHSIHVHENDRKQTA